MAVDGSVGLDSLDVGVDEYDELDEQDDIDEDEGHHEASIVLFSRLSIHKCVAVALPTG